MGRIGQLLRRRLRRRDRRRRHAAPARLRTQAVHLRRRLRARLHARHGAPRHRLELPDGGRRRRLHPAQLRRPIPRSAPRQTRPRRIRKRPRRRHAFENRSPRAPKVPAPVRLLHTQPHRRLLRPRPHPRRRRSHARTTHHRLRDLRACRKSSDAIGAQIDCTRHKAPGTLPADSLLDHGYFVRQRRKSVDLRRGGLVGFPLPGGGEDRHLASLPRQLVRRLHARRHRRRLGRQFRSSRAAQLQRRHRRRADLPLRHARGDERESRRRHR